MKQPKQIPCSATPMTTGTNVGIIVGSLFATALVGEWAMVDGEMDYSALFLVPMWLSLACFLMLLVFYPNLKELQSK